MIEPLAREYSSQPVIFLEHDMDSSFYNRDVNNHNVDTRYTRFAAVYGETWPTLPPVLVDSGHEWYTGWENGDLAKLKSIYKSKVDAELSRPPQAEVKAVMRRVNNALQFQATIRNLSDMDLSTTANHATVHAMVYADGPGKWPDGSTSLTTRYVIAKVAVPMNNPLLIGETATITLNTPDLVNIDWDKLHGVVLVDTQPGLSGAYEILQAGLAQAFSVLPTELLILIDSNKPKDVDVILDIAGLPSNLAWTAEENLDWLSVTPSSGIVGTQATVRVSGSTLALTLGQQTGFIHFTATSPTANYEQVIPITVVVSEKVVYNYLPAILR